jgi:hypothetical protein
MKLHAAAVLFAILVGTSSLTVFGQASAPLAKPAAATTTTWKVPRTADGQPDLQGVWTNATSIPMERPKDLGAKEFYTPQEAAEIAAKGYHGDRNPLPEAHYDMSQFGIDPTQNKFAQNLRTSLIVGPEGRIPPMLPEAVKRNAARAAKMKGHEWDGAESRNLAERCIMWAQEGPPMLGATYNNNLEIVQSANQVAIFTELIHDARVIPLSGPLDGSPHPSKDIRLLRGDSRGHWEGDTLVVDVTNFTGKTAFRGSSENLPVIERFTRTSPQTILYEFTIDDPSTWDRPWTAQLVMGPADGEIYEYACHEGNHALANSLSAARAEEKQSAGEPVVNGNGQTK